MIPLIQQKLLRYVDEHSLSYISNWHHLYTQLYTLPAQKIQEVIITRLYDAGLCMRFLADDRSLFCAEAETADTAQTLLLYLPLSTSPASLPASGAFYAATIFMAYQAALDACLAVPGSQPVNIKWLFDSQSVLVQRDCSRLPTSYREILHAHGCICCVPAREPVEILSSPMLALGTRGSLSVELRVQTSNIRTEAQHTVYSQHAQYGAIVPNAAWQLLWALNAVKDRREDILIEGFYDALWSVEDAIFDALAAMADTSSLSERWGEREALLGLQGRQQYYAYFLTPTCSITYLQAGQIMGDQPAYVPALASAHLDFQLVPAQDPLDLYTKLQRHLHNEGHTNVQTQLLHAVHPTYTPLSNPFVQSVIQATTVAYGRSPHLLPLISTAASLYPLQQQLAFPVVFIPPPMSATVPELDNIGDTESFIARVKQAALILAGSIGTGKTTL